MAGGTEGCLSPSCSQQRSSGDANPLMASVHVPPRAVGTLSQRTGDAPERLDAAMLNFADHRQHIDRLTLRLEA
jgi:hypothetical protein